jgi:hypothetical protein
MNLLSKITAKQFTFIGLAMVGLSIIILIAWFSQGYSRELFLKHEQCLVRYADMIYGMDYKKDIMRNESEIIKNATVYNICSRQAPDPGTGQFAEITYIVLFTASMLLVVGVVVSASGAVAWLKLKIMNSRREKKKKKEESEG